MEKCCGLDDDKAVGDPVYYNLLCLHAPLLSRLLIMSDTLLVVR